jgi:hypothetical protein
MLQALELVLQNPDTTFIAEAVCSLLCSSKAIRASAQQAGGPCSGIFLTGSTSRWGVVSRTASFAKWLPAHANLISRLDIDLWPDNADTFNHAEHMQAVAQHNVLDTILALSMQRIAASSSSSSSSSTSYAAATANQQQQQRPPFALRSFSSSIRHGADLISALPAPPLHTLPGTWMVRWAGDQQQCRKHWRS